VKFNISVVLLSVGILANMAPAARAQDEFDAPSAHLQTDAGSSAAADPQTAPLTLSRRFRWAAWTSISPTRLAGYSVASALSTMSNEPEEYGSHWEGFGKRVGLRVASGATGTMMEASLGALWDEDPRYVRATGQPLTKRLTHVVTMTFVARNRNGDIMPAYARYISVPVNSYVSNAWRPDSETDTRHVMTRIPMAFVNRLVGNAFTEFWPDLTKLLHRDRE
jgi:hypothetical protein